MANASAAQPRKGSKFSSRRPALRDESLPWDAEDDDLRVPTDRTTVPQRPSFKASRRPGSRPPPIKDPNTDPDIDPDIATEESEDMSITSSFRAPEDLPLEDDGVEPVRSAEDMPIAELLRLTFAKRRYGPDRYRLRVDEPEGPSTGDEQQDRQSLSLFSRKEGMPVIVCGWVDVETREAQVRSYGVVVQRHQRRYGKPPSLNEEEYERFMSKLMDTLFEGGVRLVLLTPDAHEAATEAHPLPEHRWVRPSLGVTFLIVLAFAVGMNVAQPAPWLQHVPDWLAQARTWLDQARIWIDQAIAMLAAARHLFH